jgi:tetratricopeptide (TPR) repeat protein
LLEDAQSAMASYQREFLPNDAGWSLLYARVLLQAGHPAKAADYLATVQSEEGRFLRLLSRLRSKTDSPSQVIKQARATLTKLPSDSPLRASLRALMAEAALYSDDLTVRVDALEHFYQVPMPTHLRGLFEYDVDQLWQAYIRLGEKTGNAANLLIGDDEPWLRLAESVSSAEPVKERSIYALLAERTSNLVDQEAHHLRFYLSLKQSRLEDTAIRLYTDKGRLSGIQQIPKAVRLQLVNLALARRNITLAASMAVDLSDVGEEIDHLGWSLKRARLAIYTGKFEDGVQILRDLINDNATFNRESVDRILQVVFDLQAVDYQRAAYALLSELYQRTSERGQQREILFWMGDALRGDDRFDSAAEHYLRSALFDYDGRDMWGQTARYRAAETLTDAGFVEDARRIYNSLLEDTADPKRKAILERSMQQLFLKNQGKSSTSH